MKQTALSLREKLHNRNSFMKGVIILIIAASLILPVSAPEIRAKSEISLMRTVSGVRQFKNFRIHPDRFVLTQATQRPWAPIIYDLKKNKKIMLPAITSMRGIPAAPTLPRGKERRYRRSGLILAGKYFRWYQKQVVSFDGKLAGIMLVKKSTRKTIQGNPKCTKCGGEARLVQKYHRYFCDQCRKYVDEKEYTRDVYGPYFAYYDIPARRVIWMEQLETDVSNPMEQKSISPIGFDYTNGYFYYTNQIYFYKNPRSSGQIFLYRFNTRSRKVDWKYRITVPVRYKGKAPSTYGMRYFASPNLKTIVFWEYDESYNPGSPKGWLNGPSARGYIVNTVSKSYKTIPVMVTPYGHIISRDNRYVVMGSNQLGRIELFDASTGKVLKTVKAGKAIYHMVLSNDSSKLYVFNRYYFDVFSFPALKHIGKISLGSVFLGAKKLLVSEPVVTLDSGKYFITGVMKKSSSGYSASDRERGFCVYRLRN